MYTAKRTHAYFHGELNKFIQVAENHVRNEKTQLMRCPCFDCKNLRVFCNPTTIRSHVIVRGFVKDYMVWKQHGETGAPPPANNPLSQIVEDEDFDRMVNSYFHDGGEMMVLVDPMVMMVMLMMLGLVDLMVMMSSVPWIVIVVMMNLMMVIFSASCCATLKRRYWLLVPEG